MSERTRELKEYIQLLLKLKENGIHCDAKINEVLKELHVQMGFAKTTSHFTGGFISPTTGIGNVNMGRPNTADGNDSKK